MVLIIALVKMREKL